MTTAEIQSRSRRFFGSLGKIIGETNIFFSASALTFNIFICSIPLSLLALSLLGRILTNEEANRFILQVASEFFPSTFSDTAWLSQMLDPLSRHSGLLGAVGFGTMIVTAQGLFNIAKQSLFAIFQITERRHPFLEILQNFVTIGILGALVLTFSGLFSLLTVFVDRTFYVPILDIELDVAFWYAAGSQALSVLFTFLLFFYLFRYLSERRICKRTSFVGAFTYTVLFEISKWAFSLYVGFAMASYQTLYQGYTFMVVTGFWGFYCALMFVLAAIVAKAYQDAFLLPPWAGSDQAH